MGRDIAEDLAEFAATSRVGVAPLCAALNDVIDTLACAAAGQGAEGVGTLTGLAADWGGKAEAGIWFAQARVPSPFAALVNGLAAHAVEFDDTHDDAILHAGITVIPAVHAAAQRRGGLSGKEFLSAVAIGVDVACRLALATEIGPGETGWLLTPLCGTFGAAAGAARALGLDAGTTLNALGLAYAQAAGNGQATIDGALAKRLQAGLAAKAGTLAAIMASIGVTGARQVFEGRRGFYAVYQRGAYDRTKILDGLGERFAVMDLSYKPYPCCRWTHAALEGALEARRQGVTADRVREVEIAVNRQAFNSTGDPIEVKRRPRNVVDAQFSIPFAVAAALVDGHVCLDHFSPASIARADLLDVANRVNISVGTDWSLELVRSVSPAKLLFRMVDGSTVETTVLRPSGGSDDPEVDRILRDKFLACAAAAGLEIGEARARLAALESIPSAEDATAVLARATSALAHPIPEAAC